MTWHVHVSAVWWRRSWPKLRWNQPVCGEPQWLVDRRWGTRRKRVWRDMMGQGGVVLMTLQKGIWCSLGNWRQTASFTLHTVLSRLQRGVCSAMKLNTHHGLKTFLHEAKTTAKLDKTWSPVYPFCSSLCWLTQPKVHHIQQLPIIFVCLFFH